MQRCGPRLQAPDRTKHSYPRSEMSCHPGRDLVCWATFFLARRPTSDGVWQTRRPGATDEWAAQEHASASEGLCCNGKDQSDQQAEQCKGSRELVEASASCSHGSWNPSILGLLMRGLVQLQPYFSVERASKSLSPEQQELESVGPAKTAHGDCPLFFA